MIVLSVLIATIKEREASFNLLRDELERQLEEYNLEDKVEVVFYQDNKEASIGYKRNCLLNMAKGEYITFIDDDDMINEYYLPLIVQKLEQDKPDCIGFKLKMTTNGENPQVCDHSLRHKKEGWQDNQKGFDYIRAVTHFNPVKRKLALKVGFPEIRYAEDKPYSDKITQLCFKETYIDAFMIYYQYSNKIPHDKKYGIK